MCPRALKIREEKKKKRITVIKWKFLRKQKKELCEFDVKKNYSTNVGKKTVWQKWS